MADYQIQRLFDNQSEYSKYKILFPDKLNSEHYLYSLLFMGDNKLGKLTVVLTHFASQWFDLKTRSAGRWQEINLTRKDEAQ